MYADLGEPAKALQYHQEALQIFRELSNLPEVARQLGNIAKLHLQLNNVKQAKTAIQEALTIQNLAQFKSLHGWILELQKKVGSSE